ncbi:hypothetical protein cyc_00804 [Cyclospora cayetanensis]|uniref:Uncharacterized protein n=1 Tax=Cyclospora cayetanensis TaxID=88456 RepID=A0A1D3D886_9EIME|nr:hypothetical protein cyc_00804 [Cyclospora cayetanensis]
MASDSVNTSLRNVDQLSEMWESELVPPDSSPLGRSSRLRRVSSKTKAMTTPQNALRASMQMNQARQPCSQLKEATGSWTDGIMMRKRQHHCPNSPSKGAQGLTKPKIWPYPTPDTKLQHTNPTCKSTAPVEREVHTYDKREPSTFPFKAFGILARALHSIATVLQRLRPCAWKKGIAGRLLTPKKGERGLASPAHLERFIFNMGEGSGNNATHTSAHAGTELHQNKEFEATTPRGVCQNSLGDRTYTPQEDPVQRA